MKLAAATLAALLVTSAPAGAAPRGGMSGFTPAISGASIAPPQALAVGYNVRTFYSTFAQSTFDQTVSKASGFDWYFYRWFSDINPPHAGPADITWPGGLATLECTPTDCPVPTRSAYIVTASNNAANNGWVGKVFGGGFYSEAVVAFSPANVVSNPSDWPSFWFEPIEHFATIAPILWPGQGAGYQHFVEMDAFEYDVPSLGPPLTYNSTVHDWYGVSLTNFPLPNNHRIAPVGTDFTQFHTFGWLWVPATASANGYMQTYFDGVAIGQPYVYSQFNGTLDAPPPSASTPWAGGVADIQHFAILFGTGVAPMPFQLQSVVVWQATTANNLEQ